MNAKTIIASISLAALPAVDTDLEGGTFAGLTTIKEGTHCAVVLLPGTAEELTWEAAKAWAAFESSCIYSTICRMASATWPVSSADT